MYFISYYDSNNIFYLIFSLCEKSYNVMNDIWTTDNSTLEYYGECLNELNSNSYLLVIESYLLKSMSSVNKNLACKYKVILLTFYSIFMYYVIIME